MSKPKRFDAYVSASTQVGLTYKIGVSEDRLVLELYSNDGEIGEGVALEMCDEAPASSVLYALAAAIDELAEDAAEYEAKEYGQSDETLN